MLLDKYPDITKQGFDINSPCPAFGWPNMVIRNTDVNSSYPKHFGPLTIKYSISGCELFTVSNINYKVNGNSYLLINKGSEYSCRSLEKENIETISVFFSSGFVNDVVSNLSTHEDRLLDGVEPVTDFCFIEALYPKTPLVTNSIMKFRYAIMYGVDEDVWVDEEFYRLLLNLLKTQKRLSEKISNLSSVKKSTREEIYKRVSTAREYIDDNLSKELSLELVARQACMSNYHFIRSFKSIFNTTPHQYLIFKRLELSCQLIMRTEKSITGICFEVGFKSLSSFSWLFKQRFGMTPQEMRNSYEKFLTKLSTLK